MSDIPVQDKKIKSSGSLIDRLVRVYLRLPIYWRLQIPGLAAVVLTGVVYCVAYYGQDIGAVLAMTAWATLVAAVLMEAMHLYYRHLIKRQLDDLRIILHVIVISVIAGAVTPAVSIIFDLRMGLNVPGGHTFTRYITGVFSMGMFYSAWSVLYFALKRSRAADEARKILEETQALASRAELAMLRYQLNPHFLFNSLTSLRQQIADDPHKARIMTGELADYLRYTLQHGEQQEIPLGEELEAIEKYLALEKIRFEERLEICFTIDPETRTWPVPTFLLQPLVENAFKHTFLNSTGQPLRLFISATLIHGTLELSVANRGRWKPGSEEECGIGLSNLRRRLQALYPNRYSFEIGQQNADVIARITLRSS